MLTPINSKIRNYYKDKIIRKREREKKKKKKKKKGRITDQNGQCKNNGGTDL